MTSKPPSTANRVPAVVIALAEGLATILEDQLVGLYLGGSLSMDDFVPATSVYDVLVVTDGALSTEHLTAVAQVHGRLLETHAEASRLEGDYAPRHLIIPAGTLAPVPGIRHGVFIPHSPEIMLSADNIANMRRHGIPVFGPPPDHVLPDVTPNDVRSAVHAMLLDVSEDCATEEEAATEILNLVRSLSALETGEPTTKSRGAAWALSHLDPRWHAPIQRALAIRHGAFTSDEDHALREALPEMIRALRPLWDAGSA